jgi:hypothetical protein
MLEFSRFLYEFNLLYETCRLVTDPQYREFDFPKHTFRRQVSPLKPNDRLTMDMIRQESPWQLATSVLANPHTIDAVAGMFMWLGKAIFVGKAYSWLLDQQKKQVEIKKGKQGIEKGALEIEKLREEVDSLRLDNQEKRKRTSAELAPPKTNLIEVPTLGSAMDIIASRMDVRALQRRLTSRGAIQFTERSAHILKELHFRSDEVEADFVIRRTDHENG